MKQRICKNCKFWANEELSQVGECRFDPPRVFPMPQQGLGGVSMSSISIFPPIGADKWCGKWMVDLEKAQSKEMLFTQTEPS